ncbi:hypothetical protein [Tsuneonella sp. SYSU-LHT278]|uniref:hypothetical protein n=1 Tax=Tsuneonella sediminis TaxID=3416089 RepID=UPI003F7A2B92
MSKTGRSLGRGAKTGSFTIDKRYIKTQAREAVTLFLAPVSGVYRAAVGKAQNRPKITIRDRAS